MEAQHSPKKKRSLLKIIGIVIGCIILALALVVAGFAAFMRISNAAFYDSAEVEFPTPGIDAGFVPQDLDYIESTGTWVLSGYMADGSASPLYKHNADGSIARINVNLPDGFENFGHGSGITSNDSFAYLTTDEGYMVFDIGDIISAADGDSVTAIGEVTLNVSPAFLNIENGVMYAGNFYDEKSYPSPDDYHMTAPDGEEHAALMFAFKEDPYQEFGYDLTPACVYSIPKWVQGTCTLSNGNIILSTSWALNPSKLLAYDASKLSEPDSTFAYNDAEVPLYFLDSRSLASVTTGPPMLEGIEEVDGKVYIAEESASNKYVFGKLYGAGNVLALEL